MTKVEFDKWVDEMMAKYYKDNNVRIGRLGSKTYIAYNSKKDKIGKARCHPDDEFNRKIGIAIAYARCKGIEVPKISTYKKFCELKNGDKFIVDGRKYVFIGKCYIYRGWVGYVIQRLADYELRKIDSEHWNKEVEMVE